jgi:hypothetical protein
MKISKGLQYATVKLKKKKEAQGLPLKDINKLET